MRRSYRRTYGSFAPTASISGRVGLMARHFTSACDSKCAFRLMSTFCGLGPHVSGERRSNCLKRIAKAVARKEVC